MCCDFPLSKANRLKLAQAFRRHPRVDLAIDCAIEGQMGMALVDDPANPTAYCIVGGPFRYYAGDAEGAGGRALLLDSLGDYDLLMPSPEPWPAIARAVYGERLLSFLRYQFSSDSLNADHLAGLLARSRFGARLTPIDTALAAQLMQNPAEYDAIAAFDSAEDFAARGLGFALVEQQQVLGAAYSSLVCSRGIEVSIFVAERQRGRGLATALASRLLLACLERGLQGHWDAANPPSYKLALKLGYTFVGMYKAWFHT